MLGIIVAKSRHSGIQIEAPKLTLTCEHCSGRRRVQQRNGLCRQMSRERQRRIDHCIEKRLGNLDLMMIRNSTAQLTKHLSRFTEPHLCQLRNLNSPAERFDIESRLISGQRSANEPRALIQRLSKKQVTARHSDQSHLEVLHYNDGLRLVDDVLEQSDQQALAL